MKTCRDALANALRDANLASVLAAILALVVFTIDALTPLDIAVAVLYVVVVLLVASSGKRAATIGAGWVCIALTLLGFLISHYEIYSGDAIARCVVSLLAIATTSILAVRNLAVSTTMQQQERALERSEAFLRGAQSLSRTGTIAVRLPQGEMWWSDETYRILAYAKPTVPTRDAILARTHPDDLAVVRDVFEPVATGAARVDIAYRLSLPDGEIKHVHYVAQLTATQSGDAEYVGALMDISDCKRAQEALARSNDELAHATRITILGELAASIAHEVTQPIAAVLACGGAALRWLNRPEPKLDEVTQSIRQMIRDAKRADEVIQRIRSLAKKRDRQPVTVDLNSIVGESIQLVRRELERHRIELQLDLAMPSVTACCDRVQLQQVLINLIMNSVQAMSDQDGPRKLRIAIGQLEHNLSHVSVQDTGTGISADEARCLFNTFFTTKAEGMGMGLSICRSIVEAHGGRIWAESPAHGGALLQFVLPIDEGKCDEHEFAK